MFYIFAIMLALDRMYVSFLQFYIIVHFDLFGTYLCGLLKFQLGVIQCWILLEIGLRVNQNIRMAKGIKMNFAAGNKSLS